MNLAEFVEKYGEPFSETLGINLASMRNTEIVKWFLASILYSKPIRENLATSTYKVFEVQGVLSADKVLERGWSGLVQLLDEGGYVRYDFSTATKLLSVFGALKKNYDSDIWRIHDVSKDSQDLEKRLKALGKGIGDTTVSVFLRDLRTLTPQFLGNICCASRPILTM